MGDNAEPGLSAVEIRDLRDIAGTMIPKSPEHGVPGADDPAILDDIARSLGRDLALVRAALAAIAGKSGGAFAGMDRDSREALINDYYTSGAAPAVALGRVILGAYYRDDRVLLALKIRRALPSRTVTPWNRETGPCSTRCAIARLSGGTTALQLPGSAEMAQNQRVNERVDVLIIGSGASGAAVAWSLAETRMRILCLEQGDWVRSTDFPSTGRDWEARRYTDFDISPNRRRRDTDYPVNDDNSVMKIANSNGVGGGTVIYTAHWPRTHPSDFRVRSLDGAADDWPVDYWALERFYDENDRMMGVSDLAGDPGVPPRNPPMPPIPLGKTGARYAQAMNRLGWHWWPSDTTIATTDYDGRAACINLGHCTPGCAQGAKAITDITYWPLAIRAGVELRTRCRVREITTNEHGMAAGVVYYDADGREHFQPAEVVIVACNVVGTPRLLLNSTSARFPNGLANSSGLVGKNLMLHPWPIVSGYVDEALDGGRAPITSM
jgi:GMC oxidoreductase